MIKMIKTQQGQDFVYEFYKNFNETLKGLIKLLYEKDWERVFIGEANDQRVSKRASLLSPFVDACLQRTSDKLKLNWKFIADNAYDSIINGTEVEHKFSLSETNSWSGHPYSNKVPLHLLIKFFINENKINKMFMGFVKFARDNSNYSKKEYNHTNSYSTIKIHNNDYFDNRYDLLIGQLLPKRKWCEPILETI